mgnify:CR=1 FL=1
MISSFKASTEEEAGFLFNTACALKIEIEFYVWTELLGEIRNWKLRNWKFISCLKSSQFPISEFPISNFGNALSVKK